MIPDSFFWAVVSSGEIISSDDGSACSHSRLHSEPGLEVLQHILPCFWTWKATKKLNKPGTAQEGAPLKAQKEQSTSKRQGFSLE